MTGIPSPFGFTIFSDDLRTEVGGKTSLIGVYNSALLLPQSRQFPQTLAKLVLSTQIVIPEAQAPKAIELMVFLPHSPDKPSHSFPFSVPTRLPEPDGDFSDQDVDRVRTFRYPIILAPLTFESPGRIKVRAKLDDLVVKLGTLVVKTAPEEPTTFVVS